MFALGLPDQLSLKSEAGRTLPRRVLEASSCKDAFVPPSWHSWRYESSIFYACSFNLTNIFSVYWSVISEASCFYKGHLQWSFSRNKVAHAVWLVVLMIFRTHYLFRRWWALVERWVCCTETKCFLQRAIFEVLIISLVGNHTNTHIPPLSNCYVQDFALLLCGCVFDFSAQADCLF